MANIIKCPSCGEEIEITEALSQTIKADLEKELSEKIKAKYAEESSEKTKLLEEELKQKNEKLKETMEAELNIRKEKTKLEDEKRSFELDKQRQMDEERNKIRQQVLLEASDSHRLKDMEKEKMIGDLKKALEDAQRKASQGSQQLQGEVQELDIESSLLSNFPFDLIAGIEKGQRGADISQEVRTNRGNVCGVILWESKRTKDWSDGWVGKLKEDLRSSKADIPVIISNNLPKNISGFGTYEGVWVCKPEYLLPLAEIMRTWLTDTAKEKFVSQNRKEKSELLYNYVVSREFTQQVESIMEVYKEMNDQIDKERTAFEKIWKARESQVMRLKHGVVGIVGSVSGIVPSLPSVKGLDLIES
jgi:hypothetical protein